MRTTETAGLNPARALERVLVVGAGVALLVAAARVAFPLVGTPVPVTLQPVAILTLSVLLGGRWAAVTLGAYLVVGAVGFPVFSNGGAGIAWLMGPTGGYLAAFPIAAFLVGSMVRPTSAWWAILGAGLLGLTVILLGGVAQLTVLNGGDVQTAVALGLLPFVPGAIVQAAIAASLVRLLRPRGDAR